MTYKTERKKRRPLVGVLLAGICASGWAFAAWLYLGRTQPSPPVAEVAATPDAMNAKSSPVAEAALSVAFDVQAGAYVLPRTADGRLDAEALMGHPVSFEKIALGGIEVDGTPQPNNIVAQRGFTIAPPDHRVLNVETSGDAFRVLGQTSEGDVVYHIGDRSGFQTYWRDGKTDEVRSLTWKTDAAILHENAMGGLGSGVRNSFGVPTLTACHGPTDLFVVPPYRDAKDIPEAKHVLDVQIVYFDGELSTEGLNSRTLALETEIDLRCASIALVSESVRIAPRLSRVERASPATEPCNLEGSGVKSSDACALSWLQEAFGKLTMLQTSTGAQSGQIRKSVLEDVARARRSIGLDRDNGAVLWLYVVPAQPGTFREKCGAAASIPALAMSGENFAILNSACIGSGVGLHELGHLLGLQHEWWTDAEARLAGERSYAHDRWTNRPYYAQTTLKDGKSKLAIGSIMAECYSKASCDRDFGREETANPNGFPRIKFRINRFSDPRMSLYAYGATNTPISHTKDGQ